MLRIILWKLGFEWAQLVRLISPRNDRKVYYFAFGANLSPKVLQQRSIRVFDAFDHALDDAGLRFSLVGFYKNHGYASADPVEGETVYGRMYLILERDAVRMDYFEGVPVLGVHEKVFRKLDSRPYFFYRAVIAREGLKPTAEYLDYLVTAYREMASVPEAYVDAMAETEVLETFAAPDHTGDFVRDLERWPRALHPMLRRYECWCNQLVEFLWNRSLVQWMIRH